MARRSFRLEVDSMWPCQGLLTRKTPVYRTSRMTEAQFRHLQVGKQYRIGMYVCTSTAKSVVNSSSDIRGWQEGEMGTDVKYTWVFSVPKGCRQVNCTTQWFLRGSSIVAFLAGYKGLECVSSRRREGGVDCAVHRGADYRHKFGRCWDDPNLGRCCD